MMGRVKIGEVTWPTTGRGIGSQEPMSLNADEIYAADWVQFCEVKRGANYLFGCGYYVFMLIRRLVLGRQNRRASFWCDFFLLVRNPELRRKTDTTAYFGKWPYGSATHASFLDRITSSLPVGLLGPDSGPESRVFASLDLHLDEPWPTMTTLLRQNSECWTTNESFRAQRLPFANLQDHKTKFGL